MNTHFPGFFPVLARSVVHLVGQARALVDLLKREDRQVVGDSRALLALTVMLISFGWPAHLLAGRR